MDVTVSIVKYTPESGVTTNWEIDHRISVSLGTNEVIIGANPAGLRTLAAHLLTLAQDGMPTGHHVHYDPGFGIEDDSVSLVIMREA